MPQGYEAKRNVSFRIVCDHGPVLQTSGRLLRLLALLQSSRDWNGPQLADELGVTTRTVRKDVERLRALGYPVNAAPGAAGGYRLGAGSALPPLLLDDDEAVAVIVGLRTAAASGGVTGIEESSLRALAKLEQVLPDRLRRRTIALHGATLAIATGGLPVSGAVLTNIAATIRDRQRLRFDYEAVDGRSALRTVEPHRLVHTRGRWYLVAWDVDREDWRTFRADRVRPREHVGPLFSRREDPQGDLVTYVERGLGSAMWRHRARVKVHAPAAAVAARVPPAVIVEAIDEHACFANVGSDSPHTLALWLGLIDADFEAGHDPELAAEVQNLADRYQRAATDTGPSRNEPAY
jgi:predicted DNA-binding transcriptional regulator YafY